MPLAGRAISAYRTPRPLPARWSRVPAFQKPPLWHFVFLSMLLHALFITLFGAPSGGSREGRALWGSLQVILPGAQPDLGPTLKIDRGAAIERLVEAIKPRPEKRAPPVKRERRVEPPKESPRAQTAPAEGPFSMPQLIDRIPLPKPRLEMSPTLKVPLPTEIQTARPTAPVTPIPIAPPPEATATMEPAPRVERVPAEPPPIPVPLLQPLPPPVFERLATPPVLPPVETAIVPAIPTPPPVERAAVEVPAIPVPPLESIAPVRVEPAPKPVEKAIAQEVPVAPTVPERVQTPAPAPERAPPPKIEREPPQIAEPAVRPTPFASPAPPSATAGRRQDDPSTTYDPTAPSIDLDAVRRRAAALAREGSGNRALLPFPMPAPPERKTKEQIAIEKARKPDCKTAYQNLGLAAVIPLIANEFGEGNCRW